MVLLTFCSFVWAFSYGLIKNNLVSLSPDFVACMRMFVPTLLFLPWLRPQSFPQKKVAFSLLCVGGLQYGVMYLLVTRAYSFLPAYQIVLFTAFTPLYVTLVNDFWKRSLSLRFLFAACLALLGIGVLYWNNFPSHTSIQGFLLVQASDLCFAFGQVAYKNLRVKHPDLKDEKIYALVFLGGLIITVLSTTLFHGWSSALSLSTKQVFLLLYLSAIASGLCFFLWNKAAVTTSIGILAVANNAKIPLGILVSLLIFHEKAHYLPLFTSLILLMGAIFLSSESFSSCTKKLIKPVVNRQKKRHQSIG